MDELVRSPGVVLTIGSEQIQTTVQASLFRGISEPLHNLLNRSAYGNPAAINDVLRHDDKDAFLALVSMAYAVVLKGSHGQSAQMGISSNNPSGRHSGTQAIPKAPKCPDCKKNSVGLVLACPSCNPKVGEQDMLGLKTFFELQFTQPYKLAPPPGCASGRAESWGSLAVKDNATGATYPLLHFAKVFALATKYEVWVLQYNAVKGFERRLRKYASESNKGNDELLDALRYLASAAPAVNAIPGTPTTVHSFEDETSALNANINIESVSIGPTTLLKGLLRYIIAHIGTLLGEEEFRDIVVDHGIIGLELMNVLRESMVASEG